MNIKKHNKSDDDIAVQVANIEKIVQGTHGWKMSSVKEVLDFPYGHIMTVQHDSDLAGDSAQNYISNEVVGYCLYNSIIDSAEILRIGTHPDMQRRGVAKYLLEQLIIELVNNKVDNLLLEVREDNKVAFALYLKQGFQVIDRRKGYYKNSDATSTDALIMQLKLTE